MAEHREVMADVVASYAGEQQRRTHLKLKTRTADNPGLSFWTTTNYTLRKALEDPDNLAENLIDYVGGQYLYHSRRLRMDLHMPTSSSSIQVPTGETARAER